MNSIRSEAVALDTKKTNPPPPASWAGRLWLAILILLPKNALSRVVGLVMDWPLPGFLLQRLIRLFMRVYHIEMGEAAQTIEQFQTFNAFFTRALKPEARPIDSAIETVVSPVDGRVATWGILEEGMLLQAKGLPYSLADLLRDPDDESYYRGGHYLTLYLSPRDYHRVHTPVAGKVVGLHYLPGTLYPVNPFAVRYVANLFAINERLITFLETSSGVRVAVVKVGATIVGKIKVAYDTVESNQTRQAVRKSYSGLSLAKGELLGQFQMGSTVILLFPRDRVVWDDLSEGMRLQMGQRVGRM